MVIFQGATTPSIGARSAILGADVSFGRGNAITTEAVGVVGAWVAEFTRIGSWDFFFGGFATGVWFYGLGMLEAAFGEGLHALADIADQTDRIPEPGKAVS